MTQVLDFTEAAFETEVLQAQQPVLVDFTAEWCGPCKKLAPIVEELAAEYEGKLKVGRLDVGAHAAIASRYSVLSIPTVIFFRGGEVQQKIVGLPSKSKLRETIDRLM